MSQTLHNPDTDPRLSLDSGIEALESSSDFQGAIEPLDGHPCNDHFALFYETRAEQLDVIAPFVRNGLERGEKCLVVVDELIEQQVRDAVRNSGRDVDSAIESGALTFKTVEETYLRDGTFDPDEMIDFYTDCVDAATEEYTGLRIVPEMSWFNRDGVSIEQFLEYESKVNRLFDKKDSIALCMYDLTTFDPEIIRDVIRIHPHLICNKTVCNNLYYTPPEEYLRKETAKSDVDRMLGTLEERSRAKSALHDQQYYQRRLYEITSDTTFTFDEKVTKVLEIGCDRFGLCQGYLWQYHPDDEVFEIESAVGPSEEGAGTGIPEAQPQSGQFCRQALEVDGPAGAPDVRMLGWDDDPVYQERGLESYFGVRVTDGTGTYGTLTFCDSEARQEPFTDNEYTFLELMGQWVSHALEQQRREAQLAALNDMSRDLMNAETLDEIADRTVTHAQDSLQVPLAAVVTYDQETGQLVENGATPRAGTDLPIASLCTRTSGPVWNAFVEHETRVVDTRTDNSPVPTDDVSQLVAIPLAQQGVFIAATMTPEGFSDSELEFLETTAATIEAACTRADREQLLHERETTLEAQNNTLERLNRINTTIREIDQTLVQATNRTEIEQEVCSQLAEMGPYEFAWIGEEDVVSNEIVPREKAGTETGYLQEITVSTSDEPTGRGPGGRCLREREPQVVNDTLNDRSFEPWRQAALNRGYHSMICLPLEYNETLYGMLVIYASQPGVFDDLERPVLTEMADTIAYAINAVESKKALVSDEVTELEFTVNDAGLDILQVAQTTDCECSLETLAPQSDGTLRCFFSTRGAPADELLDCRSQLSVTDLTLLSERTEDEEPRCLFEATLTSDALSATVLEHGGQLKDLHATSEEAAVTVHLAGDADVRSFVEMFQTKYPDSTLTAQRSHERSQQTAQEFRSAMLETLTERQREVLQMAYFNGYFEEPRVRTAREVADTLDITQPTFNSHIRAAHRKICQHFFGETRQV